MVLSYPDRPYLVWSYTDGRGARIQRDNPRDFTTASGELFQWFSRFRGFVDKGAKVLDMTFQPPPTLKGVSEALRSIRDEDGERRHATWLSMIKSGEFGFKAEVEYVGKGPGSWKAEALGTRTDLASNEREPLPYPPGFLTSNWKRFHDALQAHRFFVVNELLAHYGILSS